jgi:parallel beta-helix repeat protein
VRLAVVALEDRWVPATFTVNNPTDTSVIGETDLREAIAQANATSGPNTIVFDSTVFATPQTIVLTGSQLELTNTSGATTITGPTAGLTVSGGGQSRVFDVDEGVAATISGLAITDGADFAKAGGGGVFNDGGVLALTNCNVSGNYSNYSVGGGVFASEGSTSLNGCTISGNNAQRGGGLSNDGGGLSLINCSVSGNSATYSGGGVYAYPGGATTVLTDCTVSGNIAGNGGGISNDSAMTVTNCTVSGNEATGKFNDYGGVRSLWCP